MRLPILDDDQLRALPPPTILLRFRHGCEGPGRALIAAACGINAGNAGAYAAAGADMLVTSAPYSANPLDVAVRIRAEG